MGEAPETETPEPEMPIPSPPPPDDPPAEAPAEGGEGQDEATVEKKDDDDGA